MSADTCYRLESVTYGPLPEDYPLQIGSIAKFPDGKRPPEAAWNNATGDWVSMRWGVCPDPSKRHAITCRPDDCQPELCGCWCCPDLTEESR